MLLPHAASDSQEKGRLSRPEVGRGRKPLKKSIPISRLVSGTALDRLGRKFTDLESIRKEGFTRVSNLVFEIWPTRPLTILPKNKGGRPKVASNTGANRQGRAWSGRRTAAKRSSKRCPFRASRD